MAIKNLTGPSIIAPTAEAIRKFSELEHAKQERPVSTKRLDHLRKEASEGRFRSPEWASVYCNHNGRQYRLNGQHTTRIISELPMEKRPPIIISKFECDTLDEVAELFSTFDNRESARTSGDVNRAVFESCEALQGYPSRLAAVVVSAISVAMEVEKGNEPTDAKKFTAYEKAKLAASQSDFLGWLRANYGYNNNRMFMRASVVAAMLLTYRKDPESATEFWNQVRDGSNPNPNSPSRLLQAFLMTRTMTSSSYSATGRKQATPREFLSKAICSYNAFKKNEPTRLNYYADKPIPKIV